MTKPRLLLPLLAMMTLLCTACPSPRAPLPPVNTKAVTMEDTTLGPGDIFLVTVFGEKDLSGRFLVSAEGTIEFPLIETLKVQGKTPSQVGVMIKRKLATGYLKKPHVSIFVEAYNSKKISVFGQVRKPGTFNYVANMSVIEAISQAGGFTPMASKNKVSLTRVTDGKSSQVSLPVEDIGEGKKPNYLIRPGDIIFVPERVF